MKNVGEKTAVMFNAFAFETVDKKDQPITMIGIFTDTQFNASTTRSGWFVFDKVVEDIAKLTSSKVETVMGTLRKSGKTFQIFLDVVPPPSDFVNDKGQTKLRYDVRNVKPIGFQYEE